MMVGPHRVDVTAVAAVLVAAAGCRSVLRSGRVRDARLRLRRTGAVPSAPRWGGGGQPLLGPSVPTGPRATLAAGASIVLVASLVIGPVLVAVTIAIGGLVFVGMRRERVRSARRRADALLPGFLDELARRLRAGRSLRAAIEEAGAATPEPLGPAMVDTARRAALGVPLGESLDVLVAEQASPSLHLVVAALDLATPTGASQVQAVEGVATTLRDRLALAAEVRALASQARASAAVLVVAPVGFTAVIAFADPSTAHFLFATPTGLACLLVGLGLDGIGAWWMRRLTAAVG